MAEKPSKENIQGVDKHLVKLNNNGLKSNHASIGRKLTGGASASPPTPRRAPLAIAISKDAVRPSDVTTGD